MSKVDQSSGVHEENDGRRRENLPHSPHTSKMRTGSFAFNLYSLIVVYHKPQGIRHIPVPTCKSSPYVS